MNFKYFMTSIMLVLIASAASTSFHGAYAQNSGMSITASAEAGSDMILISGQTTSTQNDITLRVTSPSGSNVVDIAQVQPDEDGNFDVKFVVGKLWSENGFYTIAAKQGLSSFHNLKVYVEVNNGLTMETVTTESLFNAAMMDQSQVMEVDTEPGLSIEANAVVGSTTIEITGMTDKTNMDVTFVVKAPNGENIVTADQVSPNLDGSFAIDISTGGPLWKQDGNYTVTAQQGDNPEYMDSVIVEIEDGVIVPEFGTIAVMILVVAIISIIAITSRSRLSIMPRY